MPPNKGITNRDLYRRYIRMHFMLSAAAFLLPFILLLKIHTSPNVLHNLEQFYPERVASIQIIMSLAVLCLAWFSFVFVFRALLQEQRRGFMNYREKLIALKINNRGAIFRVSLILLAIAMLFGLSSWLNQ